MMSAISASLWALPLLLAAAGAVDARATGPRMVSEAQAKALVTAYLTGTGASSRPKFGLDRVTNSRRGGFHVFAATADNGPEASVNLGFYAVDRRTGDLWDGVACEELDSASLTVAQHELRASLGLSERAYRRMKRPGPMC